MYIFFGSGPYSPLALRFFSGADAFVESALVHVAVRQLHVARLDAHVLWKGLRGM